MALWDLMRVVAIVGGVSAGVATSMGGHQATLATWVAGGTGLLVGASSLPLTNALGKRLAAERAFAVFYGAVFLGTTALCIATVIFVRRLIAA
jgi:hypothetical protein